MITAVHTHTLGTKFSTSTKNLRVEQARVDIYRQNYELTVWIVSFCAMSGVRCLRPQCWWTSFAIVAPAGFSSQRGREESYCSSPPSAQLAVYRRVDFRVAPPDKRLLGTWGLALFCPRSPGPWRNGMDLL
jgi:hypothetical protein